MTLTVAEFQQTTSYPMQQMREAYKRSGGLQPGVIEGWTLTNTTGLGMSLGPGQVLVDATTLGGKGYYHVENDAAVTLTATAANATNPRIDQLIVTVADTALGGGSDSATLSILPGTPTAGANLSNRSGAATLPIGSFRLYDLWVPASLTTFTASTHFRDKSTRARGSLRRINNPSDGDSSVGVAAQASAVAVAAGIVMPTAVKCRVQSSGKPLRVMYNGLAYLKTLGGGVALPQGVQLAPFYSPDITGGAGTYLPMNARFGYGMMFDTLGQGKSFNFDVIWLPPSAGDYLISLGFYVLGSLGTAPVTEVTVRGGGGTDGGPGEDLCIVVEEMPSDNSALPGVTP